MTIPPFLEKVTTPETVTPGVPVPASPIPGLMQLALFPDLVPPQLMDPAEPVTEPEGSPLVRDPRQLLLFPEESGPEEGIGTRENQNA